MRKKFALAIFLNKKAFIHQGRQYTIINDFTAYHYDSDTVLYKDIDF